MSDSVFARLTAALADRYRLESELGQGGMATVYLARDLKHDRGATATYQRAVCSGCGDQNFQGTCCGRDPADAGDKRHTLR